MFRAFNRASRTFQIVSRPAFIRGVVDSTAERSRSQPFGTGHAWSGAAGTMRAKLQAQLRKGDGAPELRCGLWGAVTKNETLHNQGEKRR